METDQTMVETQILTLKRKVSQRLSMVLQLWSVSLANASQASDTDDLAQRANLLSQAFHTLCQAEQNLQHYLKNMAELDQLEKIRKTGLKHE